jgi:hypothetical protein
MARKVIAFLGNKSYSPTTYEKTPCRTKQHTPSPEQWSVMASTPRMFGDLGVCEASS